MWQPKQPASDTVATLAAACAGVALRCRCPSSSLLDAGAGLSFGLVLALIGWRS